VGVAAYAAAAFSKVQAQVVDLERQNQLATLYQALTEDYGSKVRQFSLNRAQWQSVQTLRSLEEAVTATTSVLIARDKTLITYFELLLQVLEDTPGIELTLKQESKTNLIARIEWLRNHEQSSMQSVDRSSVNLRSDEFTAASEQLLLEARKALMLIRVGRIQTTFDRANGLYGRILERNTSNPGSTIKEFERKRAYAQVDVLREEIQLELQTIRESLDATTAPQGRVEENYESIISSLEAPYAKTSKYIFFLEELAQDSW
jgi:hypothetical protein